MLSFHLYSEKLEKSCRLLGFVFVLFAQRFEKSNEIRPPENAKQFLSGLKIK